MKFSLALSLLMPQLGGAASSGAMSPVALSAAVDSRIAEVRSAPTGSTFRTDRRNLSIAPNRPSFLNSHRRFHALSSEANADVAAAKKEQRQAAAASQESCDSAFLGCMPHEKCLRCFATMQQDDIDWASVKPETPCVDVVKFLVENKKCKDLENDQGEKDVFCNTFNNCVIWDDPDTEANGRDSGAEGADDADSQVVDCDSLTECNWDGIHSGFIGDGICHDAVPGCYNHEICNYDGGDCCEDTCKADSDHVECGNDGWACRNPESKNCDPFLSSKCPIPDGFYDDDAIEPLPDCGADQTVYRLVQYDSWGDGWDNTQMTIKDDADKEIYDGSLDSGAEGTSYICLSTDPSCYHVVVNGGIWGNEITWEVRPLTNGAPPVADGGAPQECDFAVGGDACEKTCDGRPDKEYQSDPNYKGYMEMLTCLKDKCVIQVGACDMDTACKPCMMDDPPSYCLANENYKALIDCALCHCIPEEIQPTEFCNEMEAPGAKDKPKKEEKDKTGVGKQCNADQTLKGSSAVMKFAECASVEQVSAMVTEFDENHFGALDTFESCAHSYTNDANHGGRRPLDCMRILSDATKDAGGLDDSAPVEAIKALATHLYENADKFCSCASEANKNCPLCDSFLHFKTLLYETLDACKALDEIDCDAWNDFYDPCRSKLVEQFDKVDFDNQNQCNAVKEGCYDAGTFPAFRRLDCGKEIPKPAWDFYTEYHRGCIGDSIPDGGDMPSPPPPVEPPHPKPSENPVPSPPPPTPGVTPSTPSTEKKPYVPPPDDEDNSTPASNYVPEPTAPKPKKHHFFAWFVIFCLGGGAYWYYKRRSDFDFVRYRPARNWGTNGNMGMGSLGGMGASNDGSGMYSGLNVDMNASSFEPPTLPPTPSAYEGTSA